MTENVGSGQILAGHHALHREFPGWNDSELLELLDLQLKALSGDSSDLLRILRGPANHELFVHDHFPGEFHEGIGVVRIDRFEQLVRDEKEA